MRVLELLIVMGPWILGVLLAVSVVVIVVALVKSYNGATSGALWSQGFALLVASVTGFAGIQGGSFLLGRATGGIDDPLPQAALRCRVDLAGWAKIPDGYLPVIASRERKDDHSYYESRVSLVSDRDGGRGWKGALTVSTPGTYTVYLMAVPADWRRYLSTTNTVGAPDNTWWSSTEDLPPGSRLLDTATLKHSAKATGPDCPAA